MAKKPDTWMPLNIGDYLANTTKLTRDQHGAYLLLLMAYWIEGGPLLDDDEELAAITKSTPKEWRKLRPKMEQFFTISDGRWTQRRAEEELEKARKFVSAKSDAGKKGAQKKWQREASANGKVDGKEMAEPSISHRQTDAPISLPLPKPDISEEDKSSSGATAPNGNDRPAWWPVRDRYGRVRSEVSEKILFDVGKAVLGRSAGGQITKMRKLYRGDMRAVTDLLLQAEEKSNPAEWWAAVLRRAELDEHLPPNHEVYPESEYRDQ